MHNLTKSLYDAQTHRERLRILLEGWGFHFYLPMASAVLSVFCSDFFTVYDYRVCEQLRRFHELANWSDFEKIWSGYEQYRDAVLAAEPQGLSLRDKDRYLWGRSSIEQLEEDIAAWFTKSREPN